MIEKTAKVDKVEVDAGFDLILTDTNKVRIDVGVEGFNVPIDFTPDEAREIAEEVLAAAEDTEGSQPDCPSEIENDTGPELEVEKLLKCASEKEVRAGLGINSTNWNAVRMTFYLNDFVLPLEFPPDTAREIANKLLALARLAEAG